jgi:hypothetical protein
LRKRAERIEDENEQPGHFRTTSLANIILSNQLLLATKCVNRVDSPRA